MRAEYTHRQKKSNQECNEANRKKAKQLIGTRADCFGLQGQSNKKENSSAENRDPTRD